ncbi:hypothetical protein TNCV_1331281 [Trichonephila clavipes]|nr:hypothetical protein TNCV_1331281 [Trichonephila clavipes]
MFLWYRYWNTDNYVQFRFPQFRSGMAVIENADKMTEMIEVDQSVSSRYIAQELSAPSNFEIVESVPQQNPCSSY